LLFYEVYTRRSMSDVTRWMYSSECAMVCPIVYTVTVIVTYAHARRCTLSVNKHRNGGHWKQQKQESSNPAYYTDLYSDSTAMVRIWTKRTVFTYTPVPLSSLILLAFDSLQYQIFISIRGLCPGHHTLDLLSSLKNRLKTPLYTHAVNTDTKPY